MLSKKRKVKKRALTSSLKPLHQSLHKKQHNPGKAVGSSIVGNPNLTNSLQQLVKCSYLTKRGEAESQSDYRV